MLGASVVGGVSAAEGAWSAEPGASARCLEGSVRERALDCKIGDHRQYDEEEGGLEVGRQSPQRAPRYFGRRYRAGLDLVGADQAVEQGVPDRLAAVDDVELSVHVAQVSVD